MARQEGLGHVRLHDLRHLHATLLLTHGENLIVVSRRLGHATTAIAAEVYAHVLEESQQQATDHFAQVMQGAKG